MIISGKVQKVGFRNWLQINARQISVNGWVRNLNSGQVEATINGSPRAVEQLLSLCHTGPSYAIVGKIDIENYTQVDISNTFKILPTR